MSNSDRSLVSLAVFDVSPVWGSALITHFTFSFNETSRLECSLCCFTLGYYVIYEFQMNIHNCVEVPLVLPMLFLALVIVAVVEI